MNWKTSKFASSLMNIMRLGGDSATDEGTESRIKDIREAMHDCLHGLPACEELTRLRSRVTYGPDVQALWYLRSDIMTFLAGAKGETVARGELDTLTSMFKGLMPGGFSGRPSAMHTRSD